MSKEGRTFVGYDMSLIGENTVVHCYIPAHKAQNLRETVDTLWADKNNKDELQEIRLKPVLV